MLVNDEYQTKAIKPDWQTDDNATIEFRVSRSLRVRHLRGDDSKRAIKEQYLRGNKFDTEKNGETAW